MGHHFIARDHARQQIILNGHQSRCLADLRTTDPQLDKQRIEDTGGGLLAKSYCWILTHSDFLRWRSDESSRLLWIKGDPGKGKTMLLCGIINELQKEPARNVFYFFCQGTLDRANGATAVLRGLIYLLVKQHESLMAHVEDKYRDAGKQLFEDENAWFALSDIFSNIVHDLNLQCSYFVIDALDECLTDLDKLLKLLVRHTSYSKLKWLVSSRNRPDIERQLKPTDSSTRLSLELKANAAHVSGAISAYIDDRLDHLDCLENDHMLLEHARSVLRNKSSGTFLWVSLVINELARVENWAVDQVLKEMPRGLNDLYDRMVQQIRRLDRRTDVELCQCILSAVALAYRPLTLEELRVVSELPDNVAAKAKNVERAVALCGSFLTQREGEVFLVHQSAKDYLEGNYTSCILEKGIPQGHADIGRRSVGAMSSTLHQNMYGLDYGFKSDVMVIPQPDPLASIRYCCVFWADHLAESLESPHGKRALADDGVVFRFLDEQFLCWLEALSLLGEVSVGRRVIRNLLNIAQKSGTSPRLVGYLEDAEKFVHTHGSIIERAPLQAYGSALVFSPRISPIRKSQWAKRLPCISKIAGTRENWDAHRQTLEGHGGPVRAVSFSHDGTTLASASDDKTVRLWDAATGTRRQMLVGHSGWVRAVVFSPDGTKVASASDDKTIRLWDVDTGKHSQTLKGHDDRVTSVAFSPDGKTLASSSSDKTVRLWNPATGKTCQKLDGHGGSVRAVAFSPNGGMLASASDDKTIRLWDAATGEHDKTLEGHGGWVLAVAFSHDGKTVASASMDETVRLWEAATGKTCQKLDGHGGSVRAVAFSPDGEMLASASSDMTARLWDVARGEHRTTLEGHGRSVWAISFSHDSKTLATASSDKTVRLWDTAMITQHQAFEGHGSSVRLVVFSRNGKTLASASDDKTVRLWDVATGTHSLTLKEHNGPVTAMAFSPKGTTLACASGKTVWLWDVATGNSLHALTKRHSCSVRVVAFSHDGKTLASDMDDGITDSIIQLWDVDTGAQLQTLERHRNKILTVAVSNDSKMLATASDDQTVCLWNAATGAHTRTLKGHNDSVTAVAFSPDGTTLLSTSNDRTVRLWDTDTKTHHQIRTLEGHDGQAWANIFSPDGKMLACASGSKTVRLWNVATGMQVPMLKGHSESVRVVVFSPDSKTLATASYDKTVRLWDVATGWSHQTLEGHDGSVTSVAFSPDRTKIASASYDKTVRLWDAATGQHSRTLKGHGGWVTSVAFSPDSTKIASASYDKTVRLWDAATGQHSRTLEGHGGSVTSVAFSPDSTKIASASQDKTVRLWDAATGKQHDKLVGHARWVGVVMFAPDGTTLASIDSRTVRLWDAATGKHNQTLRGHGNSVRDVTADQTKLAPAPNKNISWIWDPATENYRQSLEGDRSSVDALLADIFWEERGYLRPGCGSLGLRSIFPSPDQHPEKSPLDHPLKVDNEWINLAGARALWLPKEYRATAVALYRNGIVLGHESGGLTFLEVDLRDHIHRHS